MTDEKNMRWMLNPGEVKRLINEDKKALHIHERMEEMLQTVGLTDEAASLIMGFAIGAYLYGRCEGGDTELRKRMYREAAPEEIAAAHEEAASQMYSLHIAAATRKLLDEASVGHRMIFT